MNGIQWTTRLNPTISGPLHLGHLYLALVNEYEAHSSGGEFIVRWDDNQRDWLMLMGKVRIEEFRASMRRDIEMYMTVDKWTSQADNEKQYPLTRMPKPFYLDEQVTSPLLSGVPVGVYSFTPQYVPDRSMVMYPYAPAYTAERVFMDFDEGVNWLIRGIDLITECAFYEYVREMFDFPPVRQTYLPRLRAMDAGQLSPVSKTLGNPAFMIEGATKKYGQGGVIEILRNACLIDPNGAWEVANVKEDPRLVLP